MSGSEHAAACLLAIRPTFLRPSLFFFPSLPISFARTSFHSAACVDGDGGTAVFASTQCSVGFGSAFA